MVLDVMGAPPVKLKEVHTSDEMIHLFNEVYALSIMGKYEPTDVAKFEEIMSKELKSLNVTLDMSKKEKSWYVLLCMLMRHSLIASQSGDYAIQILEQLIGYKDKYNLRNFRENVVNVYWIIVSRSEAFTIIPRISMINEPLGYISSPLHLALFNSKKQMINFLKREVPVRKIHIDTLNSYFGSIQLKNKDEYVKAIYDIIYTVCMNNMTNNGEDLFDFDTEDEQVAEKFTESVFGNIGESLNEFISDVSLVSDCTLVLANIFMDNLGKILD